MRIGPNFTYVCALSGLIMAGDAATGQLSYVDRASELGIEFTWSDTWINGDLGAGVALEDLEGDGDLDLFLGSKQGMPLKVYRNDGAQFSDVSQELLLATDYDVKQILFADLDGDGLRDLVLSGWSPTGSFSFEGVLRVHRRLPGGSFEDLSSGSGLEAKTIGLPTGVSAGDVDRDGDLDLYASYWKYGPPDAPSNNRLFRNDGSFVFADITGPSGVGDIKKSYQPVLSDLDADGDLDLVVAEDKGGGITYFENDGTGHFSDRTVESGLDGHLPDVPPEADPYIDGMGVAIGDYDVDGRLDVYVTNIVYGNVMYRNLGEGRFAEVGQTAGTRSFRIGWGCGFFDADLDGLLDLYVISFGGGNPLDPNTNVDRLYRNLGNDTFGDIGPSAGILQKDDGFGMAAGDLDGNGALDVVTLSGGAPVRVLMANDPVGHWLNVSLEGRLSNTDGVGALVSVATGGRRQIREQRAGTSYLSFDSHELEFGIGAHVAVDRLRVDWPSGTIDVWEDVAADRTFLAIEGTGTGSVPVLQAPRLYARRESAGILLSWSADARWPWKGFTIVREHGPGGPQFLLEVPAQGSQVEYEVLDRSIDAADDLVYRLRATVAGRTLESETVEIAHSLPLSRPRVLEVVPNPFNPRTRIRFQLPAGSLGSARIVDERGRQVRGWPALIGRGSVQELAWDGTDDRGKSVGSGNYRFVLFARASAASISLTLVR